MKRFKEKYIGDRNFYRHALGLAIPMILQNLITNFVSMLDNIMVGQVGTMQMSGVSIVNQFIFVFNITIFGAVSGASIFGTQFYGKGDHEGHRYTMRFRILLTAIIIAIFAVAFRVFEQPLINLFLSEEDAPEVIAATLQYGKDYLRIIIWSLIPFGIGQVYSSIVREIGETKIPMLGSLAAIGINLILDYGLIFGKLGMPQMGVAGAAVATVIAKIIEALVVVIWAHTHKEKNKYIVGLYSSFYVPVSLARDMFLKGCPLLANEFLWSLGMSVVAQSYSVRGIDVVAARNIASTITNMFNVVFVQMGGCLGLMVGLKLGEGDLEGARDTDNKMIMLSEILTLVMTVLMFPTAVFFPEIYNTEPRVMELATYFIVISAIAMPIWAYTNAAYFTLRSGGKTGITFAFDFGFSWFLMIPLAFCLTHYSSMDIYAIYAIVTFSELIKVVIGYFMVKSDIWVVNIVGD